jgi:ABC-type transport system substrate-binding protein
VCLTGCGGSKQAREAPAVLRIGASIPRGAGGDGVRAIVRNVTIEKSLGIAWDGRLLPRAVEKWTWLPDNLGLRLRFRPKVYFHDGTLLTGDLAASILASALQGTTSASIESVRADGPDVVIKTSQPEGFLPADLATVDLVLPEKETIGIGPFKRVSDGPPIVLDRFDAYYQGRPSIDRIEVVSYATQRTAWASMMRGDINMLYQVSPDAADFQEAESAVQTHTFVRAYAINLVFNLRHPVFRSRDVRQALNEAVDKRRIVDVGMRRRGMVLDTPVWPFHWAYSAAQRTFTYNPDAARLRLDAAGFTEGRERLPGRMPSRFHFTCFVIADDPRLERIALLVQKQLFDIGVDMDVQPIKLQEFGQKHLKKADYEAVLMEILGSRPLDFLYSNWHSPGPGAYEGLNTGYTSADPALDKLRAAIADEDVRAAVADVQRAFFEDPPAVFLAWTTATRALTRDFEVPDQGPSDIMPAIRLWQPVRPAAAARK